jgi:hypothetical protein
MAQPCIAKREEVRAVRYKHNFVSCCSTKSFDFILNTYIRHGVILNKSGQLLVKMLRLWLDKIGAEPSESLENGKVLVTFLFHLVEPTAEKQNYVFLEVN